MKQRLLQHLSFAKPLRLALVLFTLLLTLPQTAWGQTEVTYTFGGLQTTSESGYNYTVSSTSGGGSQTWKIMNFTVDPSGRSYNASSDSLRIDNIQYYKDGEATTPATTVSFDLYSDFTLTGEFVSAEITYCTNNIDNRFVTILKNESSFNSNLTDNVSLTSTPATISLSGTYANKKYFNGNKIVFQFSFTTTNQSSGTNAFFTIKSIKIKTYDTYGLTVAGTVVSA
jgi:hypothetical protein